MAEVTVCGDVRFDWMLALRPSRSHDVPTYRDLLTGVTQAQAFPRNGGAWLISDILQACSGVQVVEPPRETDPNSPDVSKAYTLWAPFPQSLKHRNQAAWRVRECLGRHKAGREAKPLNPAGSVLVIDDANLGFREAPGQNRDLFTHWLSGSGTVVAKMRWPLAQGLLWDELLKHEECQSIVLVAVGDLRRSGLLLSHGLSWDRLAEELRQCLDGHELRKAWHLVVAISLSGALVWRRGAPHPILLYDPVAQEDEWQHQHPGRMIGYGSCIASAMALKAVGGELLDEDGVLCAVAAGLAGAREMHVAGFGDGDRGDEIPELQCPSRVIAPKIESAVADPEKLGLHTQLVGDDERLHIAAARAYSRHQSMDDLAEEIVIQGLGSAVREGIPVEQIGNWVSVDRGEIEGVRSVRNIVGAYAQRTSQTKPLSVAVFGQPGAGKSFAVAQIVRNLPTEAEVKELTFNLSQFLGPEELPHALHEVGDASLRGQLPVAFWDEFDCVLTGAPADGKLGWLRHFLVPMQDGTFTHNHVSFCIGRAVFVFAGGTHHRAEEFCVQAQDEALRSAKVGDFLSRLSACLDVLGPNHIPEADQTDTAHVLRRAVLLRSQILRFVPQIVKRADAPKAGPETDQAADQGANQAVSPEKDGKQRGAAGLTKNRLASDQRTVKINRGVLRAFLHTPTYFHGARSMESLLMISDLDECESFQPSSLPPRNQMCLHVDPDDFMGLARGV